MIRTIALALIAAPTSVAAMSDIEMLNVANQLGAVLAAEEGCGLHYDQGAIASYIATKVPPERMDFAPALQVQVMGQKTLFATMSPSTKTAQCTAITQSARHFGFTK
jgi:hypothetical protein